MDNVIDIYVDELDIGDVIESHDGKRHTVTDISDDGGTFTVDRGDGDTYTWSPIPDRHTIRVVTLDEDTAW